MLREHKYNIKRLPKTQIVELDISATECESRYINIDYNLAFAVETHFQCQCLPAYMFINVWKQICQLNLVVKRNLNVLKVANKQKE
jgi:hypothetical protein